MCAGSRKHPGAIRARPRVGEAAAVRTLVLEKEGAFL